MEKRFSQRLTALGLIYVVANIGDTCGSRCQGDATGCGFQNFLISAPNADWTTRTFRTALSLPRCTNCRSGKGRAFLAGAPGVVDAVLGGWSVGSIVSWASVVPFSPTVQGNPANTGTNTVVVRPDVVGDPNSGTRTLQRDFNIDAFVRPANFTYGNSGRNVLRGRPQFNWDFSALKTFQLMERLRLQFRFEAFTLTNTPRFGAPGNVVGTANFGVITGSGTPRNLQFGLKLIW